MFDIILFDIIQLLHWWYSVANNQLSNKKQYKITKITKQKCSNFEVRKKKKEKSDFLYFDILTFIYVFCIQTKIESASKDFKSQSWKDAQPMMCLTMIVIGLVLAFLSCCHISCRKNRSNRLLKSFLKDVNQERVYKNKAISWHLEVCQQQPIALMLKHGNKYAQENKRGRGSTIINIKKNNHHQNQPTNPAALRDHRAFRRKLLLSNPSTKAV
jgi:hypothetical protein